MTDTPVTTQPPSRLDKIKAFIGDLARPFAIISTSAAASASVIMIAKRVESFEGGAAFIAAVFAGLGALYWGKAWEVGTQAKQAANVAIATGTPPTAPAEPSDGELPPDQRVRP
jgi:hypothetical protein